VHDEKGIIVKAAIAKLALIGLPALVAGGLVAPGSAFARPSTVDTVVPATSPSQCPSGDLCFWVDAGYVGQMGKFAGNNANWTDFSEAQCKHGNWNDCASAIYNHGASENARVFQNSNYQGGVRCIARGTLWSDLTKQSFNNGGNMNDAISSNDWTTAAC
jgi:hypothetical protein